MEPWGPDSVQQLYIFEFVILGAPDFVPAGAFWELKKLLFDFFKPFLLGVLPTGAFGELKI